jgi:DNA-binding NtrC family response regulator
MTSQALKINGRNPRILVVDDEEEILQALSFILRSNGCEVAVASNGAEAHAKIQEADYDVILCDFRMPTLNGLDFMSKTRNIGIETPFIFITGYADNAMLARALRLGAHDYIEKPCSREKIMETMHRVLELESRRQEARQIITGLCTDRAEETARLDALQHQMGMIRSSIAKRGSKKA